jgi:hypothetical protein
MIYKDMVFISIIKTTPHIIIIIITHSIIIITLTTINSLNKTIIITQKQEIMSLETTLEEILEDKDNRKVFISLILKYTITQKEGD